jgi:hypothetical protein
MTPARLAARQGTNGRYGMDGMTMTRESDTGELRAGARSIEQDPGAPRLTPSPGPAERALDVFIGRWINEGETVARPGLPAERIVTSDVYEWAPGGFFIIHTAYGRVGDTDGGGVEIIGSAGEPGAYTSRFFDSLGNERISRLTAAAGVWTWQSERTRCNATFDDHGRVQHAVHERSDDGTSWQQISATSIEMIRKLVRDARASLPNRGASEPGGVDRQIRGRFIPLR